MEASTRRWGGLVFFIVLCFATAWAGAGATSRSLAWYAALRKPSWTPPNWLFGPVWSILYLMMAIAAWRVWERNGLSGARQALALFFVQLALNGAWPWLFFAMRSPGAGFADIVVLWVAVLATTVSFWVRDRVAGGLMVPYLVWVSYAAALNFAIWRMNWGLYDRPWRI